MNLVLEIQLVPKEMGKLLLQSIFAFPRSFFYSVSAPLDSANLYFRISRSSCDSVQNLDRYLLISQVRLQIYCFYWHMFHLGYLLIARHETPGVCLTFLLVVGVGRLLFGLSLALGTVQYTEGLTFHVLETSGSLE